MTDNNDDVSSIETSKDNALPSTATNIFSVMAIGMALFLIGGLTLTFRRKRA